MSVSMTTELPGESVHPLDVRQEPPAERIRGNCPLCDALLVSDLRYVQGRGYLYVWRCWRTGSGECSYWRVL